MSTNDFTTSIMVDKSPEEAFAAITNVRGWWSEEIEGGTAKVDEVFFYHYEDVHRCTIKLIEVIPGKRVVWHILDNYFKFTQDTTGWVDTKVVFNISPRDVQTEVRMTLQGLLPGYDCSLIGKDAWTEYIQKCWKFLITSWQMMSNAIATPMIGTGR